MELKVQKRSELGGAKVAALRAKGFVPAELYGHGVENVHLAVGIKDLRAAYAKAGESEIINLVIDGKTKPVIIHDVQFDTLSQEFQTVDFYEVNMKEELEIGVPFEFIGDAPAVKNFGGVLVKAMDTLEIKCLPTDIPQHITIDLSKLENLNQSIYVRDLPKSDKYKIVTEGSTVIVSISEPAKEEEIPAAAPSVEDVKVESEEKKAARDAEKAATADTAKK